MRSPPSGWEPACQPLWGLRPPGLRFRLAAKNKPAPFSTTRKTRLSGIKTALLPLAALPGPTPAMLARRRPRLPPLKGSLDTGSYVLVARKDSKNGWKLTRLPFSGALVQKPHQSPTRTLAQRLLVILSPAVFGFLPHGAALLQLRGRVPE